MNGDREHYRQSDDPAELDWRTEQLAERDEEIETKFETFKHGANERMNAIETKIAVRGAYLAVGAIVVNAAIAWAIQHFLSKAAGG